MRRALVGLASALAIAGAACASDSPPAGTTASVPAPLEVPSGTTGPEPDPIRLEALPLQGLVIGRARSIVFVDLSGEVIDRVPGFRLYYEWTVPGPVILRSRRAYYELDVEAHVLDPLESSDAAFELAPQFQKGLKLERPAGTLPGSGSWAYALPSPDAQTLLGQWTAECEVPVAFFLDADGRDPSAVFGGEGLRGAAESRGLGWTSDGRALVELRSSLCGFGGRPGIYGIHPGEDPRLVIPLPQIPSSRYARFPGLGAVRMWGTA